MFFDDNLKIIYASTTEEAADLLVLIAKYFCKHPEIRPSVSSVEDIPRVCMPSARGLDCPDLSLKDIRTRLSIVM